MNDKNDIGDSNNTNGTVTVPDIEHLPKPNSVNIGNDLASPISVTNDIDENLPKNQAKPNIAPPIPKKGTPDIKPKTKWYYLWPLLIIALLFFAGITWLQFFGEDFVNRSKAQIESWKDIFTYIAVSAGLLGSYIAALGEVNPQKFGSWKPTGSIIRFLGAVGAFSVVYVALIFLP
ncbi:hypothetical protein ACIPCF_18120 (plasmid) [Paracoccus marcusii]|uniref:hypothetical protein n=1 Tax=Paracoccus TaxID=265 RepID=UPI0018917D83|nr:MULTISPECIES: hypothetical protein [Paracoccus]MBF5080045.1 hypothetical protein [Paracoccus sp. NBH48]